MIIKSKFRTLFVVALLGSVSHIVAANPVSQKTVGSAPEAGSAEAIASFRELPYLDTPYITTTPQDRQDAIPVGELKVNENAKETIVALAKEMADKQHGQYDSLLIAHQDQLVFESYFLRGRVNLPHFQASVTKVYTSMALGRAMQLGYLSMTDLNKPVVDFLEDLDTTKFAQGVEKITLHKALTMSSGIRISDEQREMFERESDKMQGQGHVQAFLEHTSPITEASQRYLYRFDPMLVMQVIDALVPGTAQDFIKTELLEKLGITNYRWRNDVSGLPVSGDRSSITSRAMLKLGVLVSNQGRWKGEQLISAEYMAKATSDITKPTEDWQPDGYAYGYYFYKTHFTFGGNSYSANLAWGGGGQHIIVVDELELVIVITGHDRNDRIMTQVVKTILPAFAA